MQVTINLRGIRLASAKEAVEKTLSDRSFLLSTGTLMRAAALRNINESTAATPYAPLGARTLAQKRHQGYSNRPLIRTGEMQRSITPEIHGSSLQLAGKQWIKYHHFGTKTIPKRPIYYLRKEDLEEVALFFKRTFQRLTAP